MRKKLAAVLVTLTILLVTFGIYGGYVSFQKKQTPIAENGWIDLSSWQFSNEGVIPLDGEWEFYPNRLLSQDDLLQFNTQSENASMLIQVPGSWRNHLDPIGMATYRLRLHMGDTETLYGIKTATVQISNRLIVNGEIVGSSGSPGAEEDYTALNKPYVSYFKLHPGWNEVLLQVANYEFSGGSGIIDSIYLGTSKQITEIGNKALTHDWVTVTAFLIMGLYFIGLYSQRKHDRSLLVFALMCICIALFTSTRGERVLLDIFSDLPFWLYLRIQMIAAICAGIGFCLYVYTAFRPFCFSRLVRGWLIVGLLIAIVYLGFATELSTMQSVLLRQLTSLYVLISSLYAMYIFILAALHKVEGSRYLILAAIALNLLGLKQNMNIYFGVEVYVLAPFEPFLVLLMLALLMSLRFTNAFRKIEDLSEQLLKSDKLKDDFLVRTSHEFKSPLHGVMNISRSMLDDAEQPLNIEQREKVDLISGITSRLSQLVYDILDFSKLKQGELRIEPIPTDVRSTVEVQLRIYSYLSKERNIQLLNHVPEQLPAVYADEIRLSQIVSNLLDNAVKHTLNGSIVVTAQKLGDMIEISVADTGEGIEDHDLPYIFEPFVSNYGAERRGFGLGLSIAKQLVELQKGTLLVASKRGVGSTFTFSLPIADRWKDAKPSSPDVWITPKLPEYSFVTPHDSNHKGKHTVLIVDDEFVNLKVLLDALQALDYRVIAVKNGYEALEQIDQVNQIDLVILDLMMPGMSGYEVCQEIRKRYSLLELPVLMVTAAIQSQDKVVAFQAGANDYLAKPFDLEEMKARISSLLAMKESLGKAIHLEVAFLQSQIKPHFLYNVLNSIVASSYTDVERARKMITDLADYLRGSFRFSNTEGRIPIEEEFQLIRTYVDIEQARFKNRIRFEFEVPEAAYSLRIPPLLLQPLVENAIRHGIGDRIDGGTVSLKAIEADGYWRFVVADDGTGIEPDRLESLLHRSVAEESQGVGLLNISKRLNHEYGMQLEVESEPGRGTQVTVRIPSTSI